LITNFIFLLCDFEWSQLVEKLKITTMFNHVYEIIIANFM